MDRQKLDRLYTLARDNITVHRFLMMYEHGEYQCLEDCLGELVCVLSNINNSLNDRLYEALAGQPIVYHIPKDQVPVDLLVNKE